MMSPQRKWTKSIMRYGSVRSFCCRQHTLSWWKCGNVSNDNIDCIPLQGFTDQSHVGTITVTDQAMSICMVYKKLARNCKHLFFNLAYRLFKLKRKKYIYCWTYNSVTVIAQQATCITFLPETYKSQNLTLLEFFFVLHFALAVQQSTQNHFHY